jgi:phage N-6-adenine-methyltransferase
VNTPIFFASAGDERGTPQDFFDSLNAEFHFDLDAAASPLNHKCELYFGDGGLAIDAIQEDWGGEGTSVFLNPPYSHAGAFIAKAREEADKGATVVMVLPVRSDTKYWHRYIWDQDTSRDEHVFPLSWRHCGDFRPGVRFRFIPGRLSFELVVPQDQRDYIKSEIAAGPIDDISTTLKTLSKSTGLPRIALERILDDLPDSDLLDGAPFPSCVVIFTKP